MTHAAVQWARRTKGVSPSARFVLEEMAACSNPKHATVWPSQQRIAKDLDLTDRQVRRLQRELETKGKIFPVTQPGAGRGRRSKHYLLAFCDVAGCERDVTEAMLEAVRKAIAGGCDVPGPDVLSQPDISVAAEASSESSQPDISVLTAGHSGPSQPDISVPPYIEEPEIRTEREPETDAQASPSHQAARDAGKIDDVDFVDAEFEEIGAGEAKPEPGDLFGEGAEAATSKRAKKASPGKSRDVVRYANGRLKEAVAEAVAIWNAAARANKARGGWAECTDVGINGKSAGAVKRRKKLEAILQDVGVEGWRDVISVLERDEWWNNAHNRRGSSWHPNIDSVMRDEKFFQRLEAARAMDTGAGSEAGPSEELRPPKTTSEIIIAGVHDDGMVSDARVAAFMAEMLPGHDANTKLNASTWARAQRGYQLRHGGVNAKEEQRMDRIDVLSAVYSGQ